DRTNLWARVYAAGRPERRLSVVQQRSRCAQWRTVLAAADTGTLCHRSKWDRPNCGCRSGLYGAARAKLDCGRVEDAFLTRGPPPVTPRRSLCAVLDTVSNPPCCAIAISWGSAHPLIWSMRACTSHVNRGHLDA